MEPKRELLRHTLAALAYRATRALEGAPEPFAGYDGAGRTPLQILAHMGDLFDWALSAALGKERWHNVHPRPWVEEQQRFFQSLQAFDSYLASDGELHGSIDALMQGPVADALTHVGHAAPSLRQPNPWRKLLHCRRRNRPHRRRPATASPTLQVAIRPRIPDHCFPARSNSIACLYVRSGGSGAKSV